MIKLVCLLLVSISMCACSSVSDMKKNAESASDNSARAADAAEASREEIANSRLMARSAAASKSRRESLAALMQAQSFELKITEAAKFLKSFEYQLVTWQKYETQEYYQELLNEGFKEFFRSLKEVNNDVLIADGVPSPLSVATDDRQTALSVYAIAAALHESHVFSQANTSHKSVKNNPESILNLIFQTLYKIESFEDGKIEYSEFKPFEKVIYRNKNEALALLDYRIDMMLLIVLRKSTTTLDSKVRVLSGKTRKSLKSQASLYPQLNFAQKSYVLAVFKHIETVINVQEDLNIPVEIDSDVAMHFESIDFDEAIDQQNKSSLVLERDLHANEEYVQNMKLILNLL